jgi:hypothetical protein
MRPLWTRLKKNPTLNGIASYTTCVATMIDGGHAYNALPQHVYGKCQLPHLPRPCRPKGFVKRYQDDW